MTNEKHKCHLGLHIAEIKHIVITFEFKISDGDSKTYLNLIYILRLYRSIYYYWLIRFSFLAKTNLYISKITKIWSNTKLFWSDAEKFVTTNFLIQGLMNLGSLVLQIWWTPLTTRSGSNFGNSSNVVFLLKCHSPVACITWHPSGWVGSFSVILVKDMGAIHMGPL